MKSETQATEALTGETQRASDLSPLPVRQCCRYCEKPEANQHEWDTIPEGGGSHLCWGECGVEEALDNERAKTAAIREVIAHPDYTNPEGMVRRLRDILSNTKATHTGPESAGGQEVKP